jgi:beta-lactamase class A
VVVKAFYLGDKVDEYEEFFTEITEIEDDSIKVYEGNMIDSSVIKKMAASELINCIKEPVDMDNLPEELKSKIYEINRFYNKSNNYFAFAYKDIFTGFTVTYNANQIIFTASAIKGPTDIYIWEMASQGKVDLDEMVTYTGNYYNTGSGVLKNKPIGGQYSVRTLLEYSTVTSDNAAHNMLMDKYGRQNMLDFWGNLGTNAIFTANNNWGVLNAHDALIYMSELYDFYARDDVYGEAVMTNFLNAYPTFLKGNGSYPVANKSGWSGTAIHDVAIVFADNPYIVVALSNTGTSDYNYYFDNANRLALELHNAYWKYKMDSCESIKQY